MSLSLASLPKERERYIYDTRYRSQIRDQKNSKSGAGIIRKMDNFLVPNHNFVIADYKIPSCRSLPETLESDRVQSKVR